MKKLLYALLIGTALAFCCAFSALAAGAGYVDGSTVVYNFTGVPANNAVSFSIYLLTNGAHIRCYKDTKAKTPDAKNGSSINKYNITPSINKGTVTSKSALKVTASDGLSVKAAERVTYNYTYAGGTFTATVKIENPSASLTGLAFVGKDGSYYYPVADGDGTIDISALVKQAAKNAAGPSGSTGGGSSSGSGGSNAGGGNSPGGGSGSGSGIISGGGTSGNSGGGSSGNSGGTGSGGNAGGGSSSAGGSGNTGNGTGNGSGNGNDAGSNTGAGTEEDDPINDHAQDMINIRDNITDITSPSNPTDHGGNNSENNKPPCVLRRIWG